MDTLRVAQMTAQMPAQLRAQPRWLHSRAAACAAAHLSMSWMTNLGDQLLRNATGQPLNELLYKKKGSTSSDGRGAASVKSKTAVT